GAAILLWQRYAAYEETDDMSKADFIRTLITNGATECLEDGVVGRNIGRVQLPAPDSLPEELPDEKDCGTFDYTDVSVPEDSVEDILDRIIRFDNFGNG
ncbi:MAG TPA: hypothetical protein PLZ51_20780, partial [Aggregatilineales bacterium]|nr:hypothetical protein [Aggregatilineales bacterium]